MKPANINFTKWNTTAKQKFNINVIKNQLTYHLNTNLEPCYVK